MTAGGTSRVEDPIGGAVRKRIGRADVRAA
jgi:hypothetical protein